MKYQLCITDNCCIDLVYQAATGFPFFINQQMKERGTTCKENITQKGYTSAFFSTKFNCLLLINLAHDHELFKMQTYLYRRFFFKVNTFHEHNKKYGFASLFQCMINTKFGATALFVHNIWKDLSLPYKYQYLIPI